MFDKTKVRHRSTPRSGVFRPYHRPGSKAAAVLLSFCVAFTMVPTPVFAVTQERAAQNGLCGHHTEHDEECGYREAEPGHPCEHKHTADCYTDELICGFIVNEYVTASDSGADHVHIQDCYELDCPHERGEHDEECGYTEGEEGVPCRYVCAECGEPEEGGGNGNTTGGNVTSFDELNEAVRNQTVKAGTPLEELALPDTLSATAQTGGENPEPVVIEGVTWEPDVLYEGEAGEFIFTSSAAGYTLAQGVEWPVITVTVEEAAVVSDEIETLCAAIDALPTVDELYENAPGNAAPEFDGWVTETKAKMTEVSALWKQLLALSEDEAAMEQITEARAEKLAALNNLAERLGEMEPKADTPTPTVNGTMIFANGAKIEIVAGTTAGYTTILYDMDGDGTIGDTEYLKIGNVEPTAGGYDLSAYHIYGGSQDADVDGITKITMTGGKIYNIYGGGRANSADADVKGTELILSGGLVHNNVYGGSEVWSSGKTASVTGDTSITLSGDVEVNNYVYGGGNAGSSNGTATVTGDVSVSLSGDAEVSNGVYGGGYTANSSTSTVGSKTVTVGGGVKIGGSTAKGIVIDGGTASVANGVSCFAIGSDLTDTASVNVQLPAGYDITSTPTIATDAIEADLAKIKLVGAGAEGREAYFENNKIKVRATTSSGGTVQSSTEASMIVRYFGGKATVESGKITLTGNVKLTGAITFESGNWRLDLNGYNLDASEASQIKTLAVVGGELTVCGTGGIIGSGLGQTMSADPQNGEPFGRAIYMTGGKLTVEDRVSLTGGKGNLIGTDAIRAQNAAIVIRGNASLTGGAGPVLGNGFGLQAEDCTVSISGSPIITGSADQHGVFLTKGSIAISDTPTVKGGVGNYSSSIGLYVTDGGMATVSGGTFTGDDNGLFVQGSTSSVTLSGGTYKGGGKAIAIESRTTLTVISFLDQGCGYFISDQLIESSQIENAKSIGTGNQTVAVCSVPPSPTVTGVTVTPATIDVQKGNTQQFSATVTGENTPDQTVTWSLEGSHASGTTISADGLLTMASDETAATLTVRATSTVDTGKSGTATVTVTEAPPAPTYAISGTIKGSDTGSGISAALQLKDSQNANVGNLVTAGADGSYTITGIPAGTYYIEVSLAGYDSGTISGIVVSDGDVTEKDLTLQKTVTFIPVTGITMTNETAVEVNTDLALAGTVMPDNATNRTIVWTVTEAGGTGAVISGSTFRAATAGTATVKAAVAGGLTANTPYEKTFTIRVTAAPAPITAHTITASANDGGTISPSGAVTVNEGEGRIFIITLDSEHRILKVIVDGADQGAVTTYTFEHVTADHSISVIFERISGGGSSSGDGSSSSGGNSTTAPSTTTSTTAGENGTSTSTTQTTSKDSSGKTTTVTTQVTKDAADNTAGSATTVTTDNITTSADQGSAVVMVKPDGAAINSAAQAAGATAASPMDILVAVPQDTVRNELQNADVSAVRMEVIIPKSVEDNPAVGTAGVTVEKETVDAARQTEKTVTVTVRDDTMAVKAVWSLDGQSMRNAAGQSTDLNLGIHTAPVQSNDPIATPVKPTVTAAGGENGLVISLTADGTLLSAAKLTVPATNQTAITAGSTAALYRFDQTTGALHPVPGGVYLVDANGNVTLDIPAGTRMGAKETYVVLPVTGTVETGTAGTGAAGTGSGTTHTVRKGDTLNQISKQYGCKVEDLLALNPGVDIYNLLVGSDLKLP